MKRGQRMGEWIEAAALNQMRLEARSGAVAPTEAGTLSLDVTAMASLLRDYVALAAFAEIPPDKALIEKYAPFAQADAPDA